MINNDRGQSLISKYVWVIETIYRRRKISFKELNELWLRDDISRGVDIPKRTFDNWRYVIWDMFGINIANEGRGEYRYYIENEEDISKNGLRSWLYNTFCVSNALANSQSIKDRIILEYVPSGQDYLQPIIEAMKENRVLNMTYHSYWKDEENNFDVQPYCVKLFRQRWYMVARSTYSYYYEKGPRIYSLDRIRNSIRATVLAVGIAFLPSLSFSMRMKLVERSVSVTMACPKESTIVSISQSPNRLPSASLGRSWILVRLAIFVAFVGRKALILLVYLS